MKWMLIIAVLAVALPAGAFDVSGDLNVGDDVVITGTLTAGAGANITGTCTMTDYSCGTILQRYPVTWIEGGPQGKAWADSIVHVEDFPLFVLPNDGIVRDVICYLHTSGAGYDSLTIDAKLGGATVFADEGDRPRFLPTAANAGNTKAGGTGIRTADVAVAEGTGSAGDLFTLSAEVHGSAGTNATGLIVQVIFEPDYP